MRGIGLGMFGAHRRHRKPTKECDRCGLRYTIDHEGCPHCIGLSDAGVENLKRRFRVEQIGNSRLGAKMLMGAVVLLGVVTLIAVI